MNEFSGIENKLESLSVFVESSLAERQNDGSWIVYTDGENRVGKVSNCSGENEFEAKEDAYSYLMEIKEAIQNNRKCQQ